MPKVLTKLRIDEISSVDRGAGDGCKVVLYKRHDPERRKAFGYATPKSEPRSIYHEIFARKRAPGDERRNRIRHLRRHIADGGGVQPEETDTDTAAATDSGNMAAHISRMADLIVEAAQGSVTRDEALAWILTNRHGRAAAAHLTKHEAPNMDRMTKNVRAMGEHAYTAIVQKYASGNRLPNETAAQAFTRVFTEDSDEGRAIRKFWQISKQGMPAEPSDDDERDGDDSDALEELNRLAEAERRRENGMSKAAAFTKIYCDPANARLAQRERAQNRPR
jgi:hypothetical protein